MTRIASNIDVVPPAVDRFLSRARDDLRERGIDRLRLYPLILRAPLSTLVARRRRLFDVVTYEQVAHGYDVTFRRHLKRSRNYPEGRDCQGEFHLLAMSDELMLVASSLTGDDHKYGPARFTEKAYPLARRPFFPSTTLVRLIDLFAAAHDCTATTLDAWGYHRQSQRPRRDLERQPPAAAAREMAEQSRQLHRILVAFRHQNRETAKLSFDRNATLTILRGSPVAAVKELVMPGISEAMAADATYEVARTAEAANQEVVELGFADEPFETCDGMRTLCDAVRQGDGLNVAVIHLNPYLQAQVLDFYTGAAIEMLVTDNRNVSLIPRSANCGAAIQRIATTIFRHFGEGKPRRIRLLDGL